VRRALRIRTGAHPIDEGQPVDLRQHDVHDRDVVRGARRQLEPALAVRGDVHGVARLSQPLADEIGNRRVVLDDEQPHDVDLIRHARSHVGASGRFIR
jgi:hypothetical protein